MSLNSNFEIFIFLFQLVVVCLIVRAQLYFVINLDFVVPGHYPLSACA